MEQELNQPKKMAGFISEMRKAKGITQKELAEQLGVTDKAVSKWERGVSCPDISLLIPLAKALNVSAGELLNGEKDEIALEEKAEAMVGEALKYSQTSVSRKIQRLWNILFAWMSASFFLAGMICFLCEYAYSRKFSWSLIVAWSLLAAWVLLLPLFRAERNRVRKSLFALTVLVFPYLIGLSELLKEPLLRTMGSCIAAAGLLGLWAVYLIWVHVWSDRRYLAFGMLCSLYIAEEYGINRIIDVFLGVTNQQKSISYVQEFIMLLLAAISFGLAAVRKTGGREKACG